MDKPDLRLRYARRDQGAMVLESFDQLLPADHPVRGLWQYVCDLDLSAFLAQIESVAGRPGAPAFDPRILLTLWLQATLDGYGSARELADLCDKHLVYRWICGGESINHHTLSDFRVRRAEALDQLLTQSVALLCEAGMASLNRVSQDGVRVRAGAGSKSFKRGSRLAELLADAEKQVETLKSQVDEDPGAASRRSEAARQRAAADKVERLKQAQAELTKLKEANAKRASTPKNQAKAKPEEDLRASATDPDSRKMRMADGGTRPAYNVQFATTTEGGVVVGVSVTNAGVDSDELEPMLEQLKKRHGKKPKEILADRGFLVLEVIGRLGQEGVDVYVPPKKDQPPEEAAKKKPGDTPEVVKWRERMASKEGREIYKERSKTAEWVNAVARNRGLQQFAVRGLKKVTAVATWFAVAHNVQRWMSGKP